MDFRMREWQRQARAGDLTALASYWGAKLRTGQIPRQYLMILAMLEEPTAQQIVSYRRPIGTSYLVETVRLLQQPEVPKKDLYDFLLHLLEEIFNLWRTHWPVYNRRFGPGAPHDTQRMLDYFKSLGPTNPPDRKVLISIIKDISETLSERVYLRGDMDSEPVLLPGCDTLGELELLELAFLFLRPIDDFGALLEEINSANLEISRGLRGLWRDASRHASLLGITAQGPGWIGTLDIGLDEDTWCTLEIHQFLYRTWPDFITRIAKNYNSAFLRVFPSELVRGRSAKEDSEHGKQIKFQIIKSFILSKMD